MILDLFWQTIYHFFGIIVFVHPNLKKWCVCILKTKNNFGMYKVLPTKYHPPQLQGHGSQWNFQQHLANTSLSILYYGEPISEDFQWCFHFQMSAVALWLCGARLIPRERFESIFECHLIAGSLQGQVHMVWNCDGKLWRSRDSSFRILHNFHQHPVPLAVRKNPQSIAEIWIVQGTLSISGCEVRDRPEQLDLLESSPWKSS